jgi:uncharacterized membrane protein YeaQ/YmgE (transglycosylase-associated protein family)
MPFPAAFRKFDGSTVAVTLPRYHRFALKSSG